MSNEMSASEYQAFLRDGRLPAHLLDDNSGDDSLGTQDAAGATKEPQPDPDTASTQSDRLGANTASQVVRVTVPMAPAKELMPNQQTKQSHWSTRSKARRAFREAVAWDAAQAMPHSWQTITGPVSLAIHVLWPKRRRPDIDAVVASCKSGIDGLADAGIFADDKQIIELTATHEYGASGDGTTRFTIQELPQ